MLSSIGSGQVRRGADAGRGNNDEHEETSFRGAAHQAPSIAIYDCCLLLDRLFLWNFKVPRCSV